MKNLLILSAILVTTVFSLNAYSATYEYDLSFQSPVIEVDDNGIANISIFDVNNKITTPGHPQLPIKYVNYVIPANEKVISVSVELIDAASYYDNYYIPFAITPYSPEGGIIPEQKPDSEIYNSDAFYPQKVIGEYSIGYLHGNQILSIPVFPVQYNPVSGEISHNSALYITVETSDYSQFAPASSFSEQPLEAANLRADTYLLNNLIDNSSEVVSNYNAAFTAADSSREYLIITNNNMASSFQELANHRSSSAGGAFNTHIETVETIYSQFSGRDNAEKIRNYIRESYINYGTRYVVLGGDADGANQNQHIVPMRIARVDYDHQILDVPTDFYYACLDGSWDDNNNGVYGEVGDGISGENVDTLAEVSVGRIAADNSTEASNHIRKIIAFETQADSPYNTLLVGEDLYGQSWSGHRYLDSVHSVMNHMPKVDLYDQDSINQSWNKSELIDLINSNSFSNIIHSGHSNVNYNMKLSHNSSERDLNQLTNDNLLFIYSNGCNSGSVDGGASYGNYTNINYYSYDSIAESFTNGSASNGAHTMIANTRYGLVGTSDKVQKKFFEVVFQQGINRLGDALSTTKAQLDFDNIFQRQIMYTLNLFGDPITDFKMNCDGGALFVNSKTLFDNFHATQDASTLIKARVNNECGELVDGVTVTATFSNGDASITLFDDGQHDDGEANDGIYANNWIPQNELGEVAVTIEAHSDGYLSDSLGVTGNILPKVMYSLNENMEYDWIDIQSSGTTLNLNKMNTVDLGFSFEFLGKKYETIYVCAQGIITFNRISCGLDHNAHQYVNTQVMDTKVPNGFIAPFWDSFFAMNNAYLGYEVQGSSPNRRIVVTWQNLEHTHWSQESLPVTFQAILYEGSNSIKFQYKQVETGDESTTNGASATVGIENEAGNWGYQYSFNEEVLQAGTALGYEIDFECRQYTSTVNEHKAAGRAYSQTSGWWNPTTTWYAVGSDENLGTSGNTTVTLKEDPMGYFSSGNCPTPDVTAPVITLKGSNPMEVAIGSTYAEPGATATDDRDGDVSTNIVISGTVDTTTEGTYYLNYDVTDAAGNVAVTVSREVIVTPDVTAPVITLLGSNPITVYQNSQFNDPGATAIDNVDGDITLLIAVTGTVDTSTIGSYTLYYNVNDKAGNVAEEKTREVIVIEKAACEEYTATLSQHESAGRARSETKIEGRTCYGTWCFGGTEVTTWYAIGSQDNLGTNGTSSATLHEEPEGYFALGSCPGPDTVAPVITLVGSNPMTVNVGSTYNEPGANAEDNVDGDISSSIVITGSVDTATIGTYYLYYNVSDAAGNEATQVVRTVNVVEGGQCYTAVNSEHAEAGRAYVMYNVLTYATGSETYLGTTSTTTSLEEVSPGNWDKVDSCQ